MKPWPYTQNPFLNATINSFKKALNISTYHDLALSAAKDDPFFQELYNFYHPLHMSFDSAYNIWRVQMGMQEGATVGVTQLFEALTETKIKEWDIKILSQYPQDTPMYKSILPNRRKPFQRGSQLKRIGAVKMLGNAIDGNVLLSSLKPDIDTFYTKLNDAFNNQKEQIVITKGLSTKLEAQRVIICNGQFANYGVLLNKYVANPQSIERYFDLESIRRKNQETYKGHVNQKGVYTILKHTFDVGDKLILSNTGNTPLKFYLADMKDSQPGSIYVEIEKGRKTVLAETLGTVSNTFLTVYNENENNPGSFTIKLV